MLAERNLTIFFTLFHFWKHLPFIEHKPKLKILQTMSEKQALEDAGETDENDEDEEIDKVKRITGYFALCSIPKLPDIFNTCRIFMLLSAKIENKIKHYLVYDTMYQFNMK